jgi:hypothetical protein
MIWLPTTSREGDTCSSCEYGAAADILTELTSNEKARYQAKRYPYIDCTSKSSIEAAMMSFQKNGWHGASWSNCMATAINTRVLRRSRSNPCTTEISRTCISSHSDSDLQILTISSVPMKSKSTGARHHRQRRFLKTSLQKEAVSERERWRIMLSQGPESLSS